MKKLLLFLGLLFGWTSGALPAQTGAALDCDGINDYVNVPDNASLNSYGSTNEITIEYWVKPDPVLAYAFEPLMSKRFTSNTSGLLINKASASGMHTHWLRFTTGWQRIDVPYTVNVWNHVAVTYQSGQGMKVYVNGAQVGSNPISGTLVVNSAPLNMGGEIAGSGFKYNGQIDEFRFWNRALSQSEINSNKDCEISGGPGLMAYYQFNEGLAYGANPGVVGLPDLSGNGNNGTLQNFALNGQSSNWIAPGGTSCSLTPGAALDFDGNSNVVNIPSTPVLESYGTTNAITVEYWVNPDPTLNYVPTTSQPQAFEPLVSKRFTSNTAGILIDKLTASGTHTHWLNFTTGWERIDIPYPTSTWSHVALTYETGSGMRVYVNGALVATNPVSGSLVVNNAPLQIGGETAVYGYKYRGQIDEFRMWDRALSAGEINARKDCEISGTEAGLLAYYQFNEGTAFGANPGVTSLPDISGNGHTGTLQNFVLNGPNSNWVAPGGVASGNACAGLSVAGQASDEGCPGAADGAIDITPSGGTSPYSFAWSNGATTEDLSNVAPGSYSVTVTDVNNITGTASFTVNPGVDNIPPTIDCSQPAVASNSLINGSFENGSVHNQFGVQSWNTYGSAFSLNQNVIGSAQDGNFFMKTFGGNSGLFQDIALQSGDQVTATIYIQNASFDPMNQVGGGQLKLEWIGVPGVETSPVVTALSQAAMNAWQQVTINTVAPPGATGVRFVAACVQPAGGAVMFDGASLLINGGGGLAGNINVSNDPGICGATLTPAVPSASDNCGVVSIINDFTGTNDATGLYPVGTTTVTWTVTDGIGLTASCSVQVTVNDTEAPTISCNSGQPSPNLLVNNSFENGAVHNQFGSQSWSTFGSAFVIDQNVVGSAQDGNFFMKTFGGNSGLFQDVAVQGGDAITASVYIQNASFDPMNQVGGGQLKLEWIGVPGVETSPVVTALGPQDVWQLTTITTVAPPGATGVRFVAICNQPVGGAVMFDNASLVVNGVSNIEVDNDPGQCGAAVSFTNLSSDNCPGQVISQTTGFASGTLFPVGTTTNTFVVTDAGGNTSTCSFDVTVNDAEAPVIDCSQPAVASNSLINGSFENGSVHNQFGVQSWNTYGSAFSLDQNVIGSAQDGNFFMKTFGANSGLFQDVTLQGGDQVTATIYIQNASFDPMNQVGGGQLKLEWIGVPGVETSPVVTALSQAAMNAWQQVTINTVAPPGATGVRFVAACVQPAGGAVMFDGASLLINGGGGLAGNISVSNDPGICGATVTPAVPSNSDNCGVISIVNDFTGTNDATGLYPVGTTTVNWTVTDAAGLTATCAVQVTVNDTEAPTISCNSGQPSPNLLVNNSFENGAVHNQAGSQSWTTFGSAFSLDQNVIGSAQDGNFFMKTFGANSGLFQDIAVQGGDAITASVYIQNASFDPMNQVGGGQLKLEWIGVPGVETSPVVTALGPQDVWQLTTITTVAPPGATGVRFVAICNQPAGGAVMFDNASLVVNGASNIVVDNDPGQCGAAVSFTNVSSDNCPGEVISQTTGLASGTLFPVGTTTNTFVVTDAAGNTSSCNFDVTVNDAEAPTVVCPADIHLSECEETATWTVTANDNCPGAVTVVSNPVSGSTFALGSSTTVTVTATDVSNNSANCTFQVTRDPDLAVSIDPVPFSSLNTCASGGTANIVLGYGNASSCVTLSASASGGDPGYTYSWTAPAAVPASAFTGTGTATPTFCADFQTTACVTYMFEVTVTDGQGCTETAMVAVNVVNVNVYGNGSTCGNGNNPKVLVCHVPPGNPANAHTICVSANAVSAHISNHGGDCLGDCDAICTTLLPGGSSKSVAAEASGPADEMTIENFPNPFDRMTTVRFKAISDTQVSLKVFGLNGQQVQVLFEGAVNRGMTYETTFDGSELPSGIYFYRLTTSEGEQLTGKMSLIK